MHFLFYTLTSRSYDRNLDLFNFLFSKYINFFYNKLIQYLQFITYGVDDVYIHNVVAIKSQHRRILQSGCEWSM